MDAEARELWKQLDQLLRKLSDLASSKEAEATHWAMEYISKAARRTHFVFYLSGALIVLILCVFILVLHRYILSPLTLASRSLRCIRDGGSVEDLPLARVRELQDMLNILPVVSRHVTDLSARSGLLEQEKDMFRSLSLVDGLTGVGNRRHFDACLARSSRDRSLALIMLDVDMFKLYNDAYGHLTGDSALMAVARAMLEELRGSVDQAFRYGGEEFCALLSGVSPAEALAVGKRLAQAHPKPPDPASTFTRGPASDGQHRRGSARSWQPRQQSGTGGIRGQSPVSGQNLRPQPDLLL